jgi:hypothetical protein
LIPTATPTGLGMRRFLVVAALLVACGLGADGGSNGGTPNDGECPEKDQMLAIQELAEDPTGPGSTRITNSELQEIREAIANVPSDC